MVRWSPSTPRWPKPTQVAALQIWQRYRRDPAGAVAAYRKGLALGGSRPLSELFAAAGVKFDLSSDTLASLVASVAAELTEDD